MTWDPTSMFAGAQEGKDSSWNFIKEGKDQIMAFAGLTQYAKAGEAPKYKAEFVVIQSTVHPPGEVVQVSIQPYANKFQGHGAKEAGRLRKLIRALHSLPEDVDPQTAGQRFTQTMDPSNPCRGFQLKCNCWGKTTEKDLRITDQEWELVPGQTPETVAGYRAKIDAMPEFQAKAPPAPAPAPQAPPPQAMPPGPVNYGAPPMAQQPPPPPAPMSAPPAAPAPAAPQPSAAPPMPPGGNVPW